MSITTLNENRQVPSVPVPRRHANPSLDAIVELGTTTTFLGYLTGALQKLPKALAKAVAAVPALEQDDQHVVMVKTKSTKTRSTRETANRQVLG